jgi:RNA polymerase sigma factor (TIGR02999 family)
MTQLLQAAGAGDSKASAELLPLVYEELRKLARVRLAAEPGGGAGMTLQPTALVHEAYLRLVGDSDVHWNSRGHFFGAAALAMRRILVDRARERSSLKRGGDRLRVDLGDEPAETEPAPGEILALDSALDNLARVNQRHADVVMLRYFAGLGVEETALALSISAATVKSDWKFARAWLKREVANATGESR